MSAAGQEFAILGWAAHRGVAVRQGWYTLVSRSSRSQPVPTGSVLLFVLAIIFYIPAVLAVWLGAPEDDPATLSGEGRYSEAWAVLFAFVFGIPLWLALGGLVLLAGRTGHLPRSWAIASGVLYPFAAIATLAAAQVYFTWPGGWSILVPAVLPPLLALYVLSGHLPAVTAGAPRVLPAVALGGTVVVIAAALPLALIDKAEFPANLAAARQRWDSEFDRRYDASIKAAEQWELGIKKLGPNSPLVAWLEYVNGSSDPGPLHEHALAGARSVTKRQAEVVSLLGDGGIRQLGALWQLDIAATPPLCAAYDQALRRLATRDEVYDMRVGEDLERQLPNLKFLAAANCDLEAGLAAAETRTRKLIMIYPDGDEHERWMRFLATLGALDRTR